MSLRRRARGAAANFISARRSGSNRPGFWWVDNFRHSLEIVAVIPGDNETAIRGDSMKLLGTNEKHVI